MGNCIVKPTYEIEKSSNIQSNNLPPLPSKQELNEKFENFLNDLKIPNIQKKAMRLLSDQQKWRLIYHEEQSEKQDLKSEEHKTSDNTISLTPTYQQQNYQQPIYEPNYQEPNYQESNFQLGYQEPNFQLNYQDPDNNYQPNYEGPIGMNFSDFSTYNPPQNQYQNN
ncbi:disheveled-associated activator of morphogenesis 2 [Anaeramoeba ignava]|uniref:Disheveled-associated activator of morphogenesis 2 n=1 Tax=Anaeramoeba ignava TaxID=1746090 RepID=A0A9Q0R5M2_ANAIG|nr:disheveled-associated activator of morphogenesis 2 [Anaeramoeba ignava]